MPSKHFVVSDSIKPEWTSCQSIQENLIKCYQHLEAKHNAQFDYISLSDDCSVEELKQTASHILKSIPAKVILTDSSLHLLKFLSYLRLKNQNDGPLPEIIYHIYGDFIEFAAQWNRCSETLSCFNVHFLCASTRQKNLLSKSLIDKSAISVCPFPVDFETFYFSQSKRTMVREQLNAKPDEILFLYAGRLSVQKNELDVIKCFLLMQDYFDFPARLIIVGEYCDFGLPYFGKHYPSGTHEKKHAQLLSTFPNQHTQKVYYKGKLPPGGVHDLMCASDIFISSSAHNDEDFGMAPAEAGACGLPTILSNWGGYSDIGQSKSKSNLFVPLKFGNRLRPKIKHLLQAMACTQQIKATAKQREVISSQLHSYCSIPSVAQKLEEIIDRPCRRFKGFSPLFQKIGKLFETAPHAPFSQEVNKEALSIYQEVYEDFGEVDFSLDRS